MKTKKISLALGLVMASFGLSQAQNGLENVVVEKYYVANAADAAASIGTLPVGSVTYRIYADMLPGYKFQMAFGNGTHTLDITSSTSFFNNEDRGGTTPGNTVTNTKANTVGLDSWFSVGGSAVGKMGVLKSEDADGSIFSTSSILANNDPSTGIQIKTQDGMVAGSPQAVTFVGFDPTGGIFDATSQAGNSFSMTNGAWSSLSGSTGPTAANRVLIGQFTTDGVFGFHLNIQIGTPSGGTEQYVSSNPQGAELSIASLTLAPNNPPTVSLTAPANNANIITGDPVNITATAADADGTVTMVKFLVDGVVVGSDNSSPYAASYTSVVGTHSITARAFDNSGDSTTSAARTIIVANNQAPTISINAAANAVVGDVVAVTATAADVDGTVTQVEFFVDNVSAGVDNASPFAMNWSAVVGTHTFKAIATDNKGATTTSANASITVANNIPPSVSLTAPASNGTFTAPAVVSITATSADADGTVTQVEFFVNNVSVGVDNSSPYAATWTSVIGSASFTAKATDNKGAITTSAAVVLTIADPNALPYQIVTTIATCLPSGFCLPVKAMDTVKNVLGYDIMMNYDKTKVTPTGVITMAGALINPSYVDVINSIDAAAGTISISAFLNSTAPANAFFNGVGELFCVEFTKTVNFQSVDTAVVSVSSLEESYIIGVSTKLVQAGKYITYKDNTFNGALKFWTNNSAINYNVANPNDHLITNIYGNNAANTAKSATAVQPDLTGKFVYNLQNGLYVDIEKDILSTTDVQAVVNGFDALLARKVLLKDPSFTPSIYQIIAMDVNEDGLVSAGDVSQINQRAVLMIPEFKQAWNYNNAGVSNGQASKDWIFVDSVRTTTNAAYAISATYPANDGVGFSKAKVPVVPFTLAIPVSNFGVCPLITNETYKGVLLGDVNGNFVTANPNISFKQDNTDVVTFDLSKAVIANGYIDVPVSVTSVNNVNALDFSMNFSENLNFSSVVVNASNVESLSYVNSDDQKLRFTSNSTDKYDVSNAVASVRFAVNEGQTISKSDLQAVAAYVNGDSAQVQVLGAAAGVKENVSSQIINVYPNPANSGLLNVLVSEKATVQLFDATGRLILSTSVNANEKQSMNLDGLANGIYSVRISNDEFVSVRRVVISK
jgi:hypothetical protein